MRTSEILREAKKHLKRTTNERGCYGICGAIGNAVSELQDACPIEKKRDGRRAKEMIAERIRPFLFADRWLAFKVVTNGATPTLENYRVQETRDLINNWLLQQSTDDIQAWRHAWLDQMIAEFAAKGD